MRPLTARLERLEARAPRGPLVSPESRERLRKIMSNREVAPLFLEVAHHVQGYWHPPDPDMPAKIALLNKKLRAIGVPP